MSRIQYTITTGTPSFTARLNPPALPQQVHNALGSYSFENIPDGYFQLIITDANGCKFTQNFQFGVVESYQIRFYDLVCEGIEITTTTTTTTVAPPPEETTTTTTTEGTTTTTTSTTTTTICQRPVGLITGDFTYKIISDLNGAVTWFNDSLAHAQDAWNLRLGPYTLGGNLVQYASLTVGQTVYKLVNTTCEHQLDGYQIDTSNSKIVYVVNGVISAIYDPPPATTTTTTANPNPAVPPNYSISGSPMEITNLNHLAKNEVWIMFPNNGGTVYHTMDYITYPWNGRINNTGDYVPIGTYLTVLKVNGKTKAKEYVYVVN